MVAGELELLMYANMARLSTDMSSAKQTVSNAVGELNKILGTIGIGLSLSAITGQINSVIDGMEKLQLTAEQTGSSIENLSKLQFFADASGSNIDGITNALKLLSKNMAAAGDEALPATKAFEYLGLSAKDTAGNLKDPSEMLSEVAMKLATYQDGAGKAAVAQALFGRAGIEMLPALKKMAELGGVEASVTAQQAAAADEYRVELARLKDQTEGLWNTFVGSLLPTMKEVASVLLDASGKTGSLNSTIRELAADGSFERWAQNAAMAVAYLVDDISVAVQAFSTISAGLRVLVDDAAIVMAQMSKTGPFSVTMGPNGLQLNPAIAAENESMKVLLDQRAKDVADSNKKLSDLWNGNVTLFSASVRAQIVARNADTSSMKDWSEKQRTYAEQATAVALAYAGYSTQVQQAAQQSLLASSGMVKANLNFSSVNEKTGSTIDALAKKYDALTKSIQDKLSVSLVELDSTTTLSDAQKFATTVMADWITSTKGMTDAQKEHIAQLLEDYLATDQLNTAKKAIAEQEKTWTNEVDKGTKSLQDELKAAKDYLDNIGKTKEQQDALAASKRELAAAALDEYAQNLTTAALYAGPLADAYMRAAAAAREQAAIMREIAGIKVDSALADAAAAQAKASAEAWKKGWEETDKIARDTFVSWATQGGNMAQKIGDALKQALVSAIYEAELKPLALQLYTSATGALGMTGSPVSSAPGLVNTASNAYSLYGGLTSGVGTGLYGTFAASGAGQALGLSSAASFVGPQAATGAASVGLTGAGAAIGTAMPYVAAAIAAYELFSKKGGGPQQGQYGSLSGTGAYTAYSTMSGGDSLGNQALSNGVMAQITAIAAAAGKSAADITVAQGYKMDPQGTSPSIAYRQISIAGTQISGKSSGGNFTNPGMADYTTSHNDATGVATYLGTLHTPELQALITALGDPKLEAVSTALLANFGELEKSLPAYLNAQAMQKGMAQSMMTDAEKLQATTDQMNAGFAALGLSVPKSTEDFRSLINGIDITTTSGQQELAALNQLGPAFLQVAQSTTAATNASITAVRSATDIANERQQLQDQLDNLTMTSTQLLQKQRDALDASNQALFDQVQAVTAAQAAVSAQTQAVSDAATAVSQAYQQELTAKQAIIMQFSQYVSALSGFSDSLALGNLSPLSPQEQYAQAQATFDSISKQAALGDPQAIGQLQDASNALLTASKGYNASGSAYAADYYKVQVALQNTISVASRQVSIAQQQLDSETQQVSIAQQQLDLATQQGSIAQQQLGAATQQISVAKQQFGAATQQVSALTTINGSILSLSSSLTALAAAQVTAAASAAAATAPPTSAAAATTSPTSAGGSTGYTQYSPQEILDYMGAHHILDAASMYAAAVTLNMDPNALAAAEGPGMPADLFYRMAGVTRVPGFATGGVASGLAMVGEAGPEMINFGSPSRVFSNADTHKMLGGAANDAVVSEIKALRSDMPRLIAEIIKAQYGAAQVVGATVNTAAEKANADAKYHTYQLNKLVEQAA